LPPCQENEYCLKNSKIYSNYYYFVPTLRNKNIAIETFPGLKNPQNAFAAGAPPASRWGAHSTPPDLLVRLGEEGKGKEGRRGKSKGGEDGRKREGKGGWEGMAGRGAEGKGGKEKTQTKSLATVLDEEACRCVIF